MGSGSIAGTALTAAATARALWRTPRAVATRTPAFPAGRRATVPVTTGVAIGAACTGFPPATGSALTVGTFIPTTAGSALTGALAASLT